MKQAITNINKLLILGGIWAVFAVFLPSCTTDVNSDVSGPLSVKIPWVTSEGYSPQVVTLMTVQDRQSFHGSAARFYLSPGLQNSKLVGDAPKVQLMKTHEGYYVPKDYMSSLVITLYAHFEKLADQDRSLGLDQTVAQWPRTQDVGVSVREYDSSGNWLLNNASFVSGLDSFLFLPYNMDTVPLAINPGVVAHEYFHAIFNQLMVKPSGLNYPGWKEPSTATVGEANYSDRETPLSIVSDSKDPSRDYYHEYLLRGINEGLADVWGWLYSQDPEFLSLSIHNTKDRNLNIVQMRTLSTSTIREHAARVKGLDAGVYAIGSTYARRIYQAFLRERSNSGRSKEDLSMDLRKAILKAVRDMQSQFLNLDSADYLDPSVISVALNSQLKQLGWSSQLELPEIPPAQPSAAPTPTPTPQPLTNSERASQ